jgi:restriction endonuclease S subunit
MAKKYIKNLKLEFAYQKIFSSLSPSENILIHDAIILESGIYLPKNQMKLGEYPVFGGGGITASLHNAFNIDYKTIGIGRVGARCGCIFDIPPKSWVTDNALYIKSYDERFYLPYIKHYINHANLNQYANNAMQPVISKTRIQKVTIPLINYDKQMKIAELLDSLENYAEINADGFETIINEIQLIDDWQDLIVELSNQSKLILQLRQSILQEAIEGKLTVQWRKENPDVEPASKLLEKIKVEKEQLIKEKVIRREKNSYSPNIQDDFSQIPSSWATCILGDMISISSGDGLTAAQMINGEYPVFGGNGINGYHNQCNTFEETITIGRVGANCGAIHLTPEKAWITDNCFRTYYCKFAFNRNYLIWYLKYLDLGKLSFKGSQPVISGQRVYPLRTFFPPMEEQKVIVEKIENHFAMCDELEQQINESKSNTEMLMQAVLKEAFER